MTKTEMDEQVRLVCRMRRLSRHTEESYAGWIARFGAHVKTCAHLAREDRVRTFWRLHCIPQFAATITSPLDALPLPANVVPFERAA